MTIVKKIKELIPNFPHVTYQTLEHAEISLFSLVSRVKRLEKFAPITSSEDLELVALYELLRSLKQRVERNSQSTEHFYDLLPFINESAIEAYSCAMALWDAYCADHKSEIKTWVVTLENALRYEADALKLLPLIYNVHLDTPVKFAGWLVYFLQSQKTADAILKSGFLHDFFDLSILNLADLAKGYGFFKAFSQDMMPLDLEAKSLIEKAAYAGAKRLGYESLAIDGSVSKVKLDFSLLNAIKKRDILVEFSLSAKNLEQLLSLFGSAFLFQAIMKLNVIDDREFTTWCREKAATLSTPDLVALCRTILNQVPEQLRHSIFSCMAILISDDVAREILSSNAFSAWVIMSIKPHLLSRDDEGFAEFVQKNQLQANTIFAAISLLDYHAIGTRRNQILRSLFDFYLSNPTLEIDENAWNRLTAWGDVMGWCDEILTPMLARLDAFISQHLPLTAESYFDMFDLYREQMKIRSVILQLYDTNLYYPKDKYAFNARILEKALEGEFELDSLLCIMHSESQLDSKIYTLKDTHDARKNTLLACLICCTDNRLLASSLHLLQTRYPILNWNTEETSGLRLVTIGSQSEHHDLLRNTLFHHLGYQFWLELLAYVVRQKKAESRFNHTQLSSWFTSSIKTASLEDLHLLYRAIVTDASRIELMTMLGCYLTDEKANEALLSGLISPWFIWCSNPNLLIKVDKATRLDMLLSTPLSDESCAAFLTLRALMKLKEICIPLNAGKTLHVIFNYYLSRSYEVIDSDFLSYANSSAEVRLWCKEKLNQLGAELLDVIQSNLPLTPRSYLEINTCFYEQMQVILLIKRFHFDLCFPYPNDRLDMFAMILVELFKRQALVSLDNLLDVFATRVTARYESLFKKNILLLTLARADNDEFITYLVVFLETYFGISDWTNQVVNTKSILQHVLYYKNFTLLKRIFPLDLVDVRNRNLSIIPLDELSSSELFSLLSVLTVDERIQYLERSLCRYQIRCQLLREPELLREMLLLLPDSIRYSIVKKSKLFTIGFGNNGLQYTLTLLSVLSEPDLIAVIETYYIEFVQMICKDPLEFKAMRDFLLQKEIYQWFVSIEQYGQNLLGSCAPYPETFCLVLDVFSDDEAKRKAITIAVLCSATRNPESLRMILSLHPNQQAKIAEIEDKKDVNGYPIVLLSAVCNVESMRVLFQLYSKNKRAQVLLKTYRDGESLLSTLIRSNEHQLDALVAVMSEIILLLPENDQYQVVETLTAGHEFIRLYPSDVVLKSVILIKIKEIKMSAQPRETSSFFSSKRKFGSSLKFDNIIQLEADINEAVTTCSIRRCYSALQNFLIDQADCMQKLPERVSVGPI